MYVSSINKSNTNFEALKSVKVKGLSYRKEPYLANYIIKRVKEENCMRDFIQHWDVNLSLKSRISRNKGKEALLVVSYHEKNETPMQKISRFVKNIFFKNKATMIYGYGKDINQATEMLLTAINNGLLKSSLDYINKHENEIKEFNLL